MRSYAKPKAGGLYQSYAASTGWAMRRSTNGDQNTVVRPLGDVSITCWVRDASMISQMKALEDENRRLKKMYAEMSMQAELLKEALGKK